MVLPNIEGITPPRPIAKKYLAAAFWNASSPANKLVTTSSAMTTTISGDTYSAAKLNKTAEGSASPPDRSTTWSMIAPAPIPVTIAKETTANNPLMIPIAQ